MYVQNQQYTREAIQQLLGQTPVKGGDWYTGHHREGDEHYIFCGIDIPGRTGHNYNNHFDGDQLIWHPNTAARLTQPRFAHLVSGAIVHVFYRLGDHDPFTYAGTGFPVSVVGGSPIEVRWAFPDQQSFPEELPNLPTLKEGAKKQITVNAYERDPTAKPRCIKRWGCTCVVCGFDFGVVYGELGKGFIHVHHLTKVASIGQEYELNPEEDLRPVCPNCHSMLHRKKDVISIEELRSTLQKVSA